MATSVVIAIRCLYPGYILGAVSLGVSFNSTICTNNQVNGSYVFLDLESRIQVPLQHPFPFSCHKLIGRHL